MRRIVTAAAMSLGVLLLAVPVSADTLILRDGGRISGRVIAVAARVITFEDASGVTHRHSADEVAALEFAAGRGRNAAARTLDGVRPLEVQPVPAGMTPGLALKNALRLYAVVAQGRR